MRGLVVREYSPSGASMVTGGPWLLCPVISRPSLRASAARRHRWMVSVGTYAEISQIEPSANLPRSELPSRGEGCVARPAAAVLSLRISLPSPRSTASTSGHRKSSNSAPKFASEKTDLRQCVVLVFYLYYFFGAALAPLWPVHLGGG